MNVESLKVGDTIRVDWDGIVNVSILSISNKFSRLFRDIVNISDEEKYLEVSMQELKEMILPESNIQRFTSTQKNKEDDKWYAKSIDELNSIIKEIDKSIWNMRNSIGGPGSWIIADQIMDRIEELESLQYKIQVIIEQKELRNEK